MQHVCCNDTVALMCCNSLKKSISSINLYISTQIILYFLCIFSSLEQQPSIPDISWQTLAHPMQYHYATQQQTNPYKGNTKEGHHEHKYEPAENSK